MFVCALNVVVVPSGVSRKVDKGFVVERSVFKARVTNFLKCLQQRISCLIYAALVFFCE